MRNDAGEEVRKAAEKEFHDKLRNSSFGQRWSKELEKKLISSDPLWANIKYYSVERKSREAVLSWYAKNCNSKRVLDYCCGNGDDSVLMVKNGAKEVIGIDVSETSIRNCRERAKIESMESNISFSVMDAENLKIEDNYFGIISEYGALHHLKLKKAYAELARVLAVNGKCICTETLGHNPLIRYYRKRTPYLRTEWEVEHILCKKDVYMAKKYFGRLKIIGFYHLATLCAVPLRNLPVFRFALGVMEAFDSVVLSFPGIKWQAWQIVYELSEPRK